MFVLKRIISIDRILRQHWQCNTKGNVIYDRPLWQPPSWLFTYSCSELYTFPFNCCHPLNSVRHKFVIVAAICVIYNLWC